jgi:hypothetical protein
MAVVATSRLGYNPLRLLVAVPVCHSTAEATSVVIFAAILEIVTDEANVAGRPGNVLNSDKDRTLQLL